MKLTFEPLQPKHAAIIPYLRQHDINEIFFMTGLSPDFPVITSIVLSDIGFAALLDDKPVAVFGVQNGVIWLIATDDISHYPVTFYRVSKKIFQQF